MNNDLSLFPFKFDNDDYDSRPATVPPQATSSKILDLKSSALVEIPNLETMERLIKQVPDTSARRAMEESWLGIMGEHLNNALEVIARRRGIILLSVKAAEPHGNFEAAAKTIFPSVCARTFRANMEKAREFLAAAEPEYKDDASAVDFARFEKKWLVSEIIKSLRPQQPQPKATLGDADKTATAPETTEPKTKPAVRYLSEESLKRHIKEFNKAFEKVKKNSQRVTPETLESVTSLLDGLFLADEINALVQQIIAEQKKRFEASGSKNFEV